MKILITNIRLSMYAGTEVVTRDLALAFQRAGHQPSVFSPQLGPIAQELRQAGIEVVDDLRHMEASPDIIHGHHHRPLAEALLWFPYAPAVSVCHDVTSEDDLPCFFPRVVQYLAVDLTRRARVEQALGEQAGHVGILPNAVDLGRFPAREPLPPHPRRALVFSNNATRGSYLEAVRRACRLVGLSLDVLGVGAGNQSGDPGRVLRCYDLVFAKGRCALEALATGNAVVLCDTEGLGPYVTYDRLAGLRAMNLGAALLTQPHDPALIAAQVARYNAADATAISKQVRREASLEQAAADWLALYQGVLDQFDPGQVDRLTESRAFATYMNRWHYDRRREWERKQLEGVKSLPLVGELVYRWISRTLHRRPDPKASVQRVPTAAGPAVQSMG